MSCVAVNLFNHSEKVSIFLCKNCFFTRANYCSPAAALYAFVSFGQIPVPLLNDIFNFLTVSIINPFSESPIGECLSRLPARPFRFMPSVPNLPPPILSLSLSFPPSLPPLPPPPAGACLDMTRFICASHNECPRALQINVSVSPQAKPRTSVLLGEK